MFNIGDKVTVATKANFLTVELFRGKVGKVTKVMPILPGEHNIQVEYAEPIYHDDDYDDRKYWFYDYELEKVS